MKFPTHHGRTLNGRTVHLPAAFDGDFNIVFIGFNLYHHGDILTWMSALQRLTQALPNVAYHRVMVMGTMNSEAQGLIEGALRHDVTTPAERERVVPLFQNRYDFCAVLGLPGDGQIYTLLISKEGTILWGAAGGYQSRFGESLEAVLRQYKPQMAHRFIA